MKNNNLSVSLSEFRDTNIAKAFETQSEPKKMANQEYGDVLCVYDGCLLMLKRSPQDSFEPGKWSVPGGKIEPGETPRTGAIRELCEETGIVCSDDNCFFVEKDKSSHYYQLYLNDEPNIVLDESEHVQYKWMTREDLRTMNADEFLMDLQARLCKIFKIEL